jgi:outer membrane protein TolC
VEVAERALENARAHLDYARRRLEGGIGSRLNFARAAQVVAAEESQLENTRLALRRAQEALGVIVVADGPVDTAADPVFEVPATIDESAWMAARPDVQMRRSVQVAAERVVHDSWKDWAPTANASFDPLLITPANLFQPSRTWRLTLTLTQPLYEGGVRRAVLRQREIAVQQAKLALTDIEIRARSQVRLAQESVQSLDRALTSARQAAERANEVLKITTSAFEIGATTNIEVIDAQRSARDAETVAAVAEDAVQRARLDLLVAIGRFPR